MAGYLNQNGNSIGSLLRFIQEQKSQSPIVPQGSEVGSPLRDVVQQPLKGSEGQGTSKVVSLRPEGTLTPSVNPIEQGTPQSSRVGPISIGGYGGPGSDIPNQNPNREGFSNGSPINPTAHEAGLNQAPGEKINSPSIGTSIKASTPVTKTGIEVAPTQRGQEVGNYSLTKDKQAKDKTSQFAKEELGRNLRSTTETQADLEKQYDESLLAFNNSETPDQMLADLYKKDKEILNRPVSAEQKMINQAETRSKIAAIQAKLAKDPNAIYTDFGLPTPTPTPSPMQGGQVQGASTGGSNNNGSTNGQIRSVAPRVAPAPIQSKNQYSTPVPIRSVVAPAQSKPAPSKPAAKAPSIGTILGGGALQAVKKLFGRK